MNKNQDDQNDNEESIPPGTPERTPVKEPDTKKKPVGDPQSPEKKKPRL
jgi:hypothetical protein